MTGLATVDWAITNPLKPAADETKKFLLEVFIESMVLFLNFREIGVLNDGTYCFVYPRVSHTSTKVTAHRRLNFFIGWVGVAA